MIKIYFSEALKHTFLYQECLLIFIFSPKIGHFDAKIIRDTNFKLKLIDKIIILLSSTLVRKHQYNN
jgi:hypothetical protein